MTPFSALLQIPPNSIQASSSVFSENNKEYQSADSSESDMETKTPIYLQTREKLPLRKEGTIKTHGALSRRT